VSGRAGGTLYDAGDMDEKAGSTSPSLRSISESDMCFCSAAAFCNRSTSMPRKEYTRGALHLRKMNLPE